MECLVTGSNGFIGSKLVEALQREDCDVFTVDLLPQVNNKVKHFRKNLLDLANSNLSHIPITKVFHLAAQTSVSQSLSSPKDDMISNYLGTVELLDSLNRESLETLIYFNSGGAIYDSKGEPPFNENHPCRPESPYGISKLAAEIYAEQWCKRNNVNFVSLRLSNVIGAKNGNTNKNVIDTWIENIKKGMPIKIRGLQTTRDFINVEDVISSALKCISNVKGIYNIGSGVETSLFELKETFNKLLKYDVIFQEVELPEGEIQRSYLDISKAKKDFGFEPKLSLENTLKSILESQ